MSEDKTFLKREGWMLGRTVPLKMLIAHGLTREIVEQIGGKIQGANVAFEHNGIDFGAIQKLKLVQPAITKEQIIATRKARAEASPWADGRGARLWGFLHTYCARVNCDDVFAPMNIQRTLIEFTYRIPCGDCRAHYYGMLKRTPPPLDGRDVKITTEIGNGASEIVVSLPINDRLFCWSVDRHNEVNARIDRADRSHPQFTYEQARARWLDADQKCDCASRDHSRASCCRDSTSK